MNLYWLLKQGLWGAAGAGGAGVGVVRGAWTTGEGGFAGGADVWGRDCGVAQAASPSAKAEASTAKERGLMIAQYISLLL